MKSWWNAMWASYRTTVCGIAVAALNLYANGAGRREILTSVGIAVLGALAKDANVTMSAGGTVAHPVDVKKDA